MVNLEHMFSSYQIQENYSLFSGSHFKYSILCLFMPYICWISSYISYFVIFITVYICLHVFWFDKDISIERIDISKSLFVFIISVGLESFLFGTILGLNGNVGRNLCWSWIILFKALILFLAMIQGYIFYLFLYPDLMVLVK